MAKLLSGIGLGVALSLAGVLAAVVVFVFLLSFLGVVSPSLANDEQVLQFMVLVSGAAVLGVPALLYLLVRGIPELGLPREHKPPNRPVAPMNEGDARRLMISDYRVRSRLFKVASGSALFIMLVVALLGFNVAGSAISETATDETTTDETTTDAETGLSIGQGLGALLLLLVLLRTLGWIHRDTMRLAALYDGKADYLQLGDVTKELNHKELLELVAADPGDSTKMGELLRSVLQTRQGGGKAADHR